MVRLKNDEGRKRGESLTKTETTSWGHKKASEHSLALSTVINQRAFFNPWERRAQRFVMSELSHSHCNLGKVQTGKGRKQGTQKAKENLFAPGSYSKMVREAVNETLGSQHTATSLTPFAQGENGISWARVVPGTGNKGLIRLAKKEVRLSPVCLQITNSKVSICASDAVCRPKCTEESCDIPSTMSACPKATLPSALEWPHSCSLKALLLQRMN